MENFDLKKYLAEGRLLKEDVSKDPSFVRTKEGLKQIFQQMLSGELSGKEANDQISDFTFGQGSMGIYPDTNSLFLRQFGMGGGDFNDYIIGKFENGGFTPATQPKSKTALKIWNYLSNLKLAEGKLLKEELTWYVEDENADIRFQNDEYLKEVGKKIKEIHPDISSEDLNKIIIMTGEQYSREEDFHGDSIPSDNFVKAAVEIYQTDVLGSDGEDDEDFDRWAPENLDGDFPKDSVFAGWTQAQYDAYQEEPHKYRKYLGGGSFNLAEGRLFEEKMSLEVDDDFIELSADSGEYNGDLNDDGTVDFSVVYDDGTEFDDSTWKSILGKKHAFVKISNQIPTKVEAAGDYVMITVDLEDLKNLIKPNKSKNMKNLGSYETKDSKGNIVKRYI
jgi:hypothetical protein